eukprot:758001-Hanusia_phi.AAC.3
MLACKPEDRPTAKQTLSLLRGDAKKEPEAAREARSSSEEEKNKGQQGDFRPFAKASEKPKEGNARMEKDAGVKANINEKVARFTVPVTEQRQEKAQRPTARPAADEVGSKGDLPLCALICGDLLLTCCCRDS